MSTETQNALPRRKMSAKLQISLRVMLFGAVALSVILMVAARRIRRDTTIQVDNSEVLVAEAMHGQYVGTEVSYRPPNKQSKKTTIHHHVTRLDFTTDPVSSALFDDNECIPWPGSDNSVPTQLHRLAELPRIRRLGFGRANIDRAALESLLSLSELEMLDITDSNATSATIVFICQLPKLKELFCRASQLDESVFEAIAARRSLRRLTITADGPDDACFDRVSRLLPSQLQNNSTLEVRAVSFDESRMWQLSASADE